jgi:ERO1-like protein alpha
MKARVLVGWIMRLLLAAYVPWCIYVLFSNKKELDLGGKIDDCCTDFRDIDMVNNQIQPVLLQLVNTNFFRRFKVDLEAKCPFWALNQICKNPTSCGICVCDEQDIPINWKKEDKKAQSRGKLSPSHTDLFQERRDTPKSGDWGLGEEDSPTSVYVDLIKNVEAYTGYQGQNIWNAIYKENCFVGPSCLEERLLNRAVSGMHASVSTHLSEYFIDFDINVTYPNVQMYFEKVGNHPDRIKNLYFAFSILLRGLNIATDYLRTYNFSTGTFLEDLRAHKLVTELLELSHKYGDVPFDESVLFKDESKLALKSQLKEYFSNITRIMDCVDCEKCKTYGKLQIKALGTALKLIFDENTKSRISLDRNEIIALVNSLCKWSTSIKLIPEMFARANSFSLEVVRISTFFLFLLIIISKVMLFAHRQVVTKFKKRIKPE